MRKHFIAAVVVGALSAAPVIGVAAAGQAQTASTKKVSTKAVPTHATSGVVKSVDASTLVITRDKSRSEMSFALNSSTQRDGEITAGAPVSVRYREDGKTSVATAVRVQQPKRQAAAKQQTKK